MKSDKISELVSRDGFTFTIGERIIRFCNLPGPTYIPHYHPLFINNEWKTYTSHSDNCIYCKVAYKMLLTDWWLQAWDKGREEYESYLSNLMLNLSSGLLPEHLSDKEISVLVKEYGDDWFRKLGYSEPEYKQPKRLK